MVFLQLVSIGWWVNLGAGSLVGRAGVLVILDQVSAHGGGAGSAVSGWRALGGLVFTARTLVHGAGSWTVWKAGQCPEVAVGLEILKAACLLVGELCPFPVSCLA